MCGAKYLKFKHTLPAVGLMLSSLGMAAPVSAQDVFQTGQTDRSYNYFQAVYLLNQSAEFPFLFNLHLNVYPNFTLQAEYANLSVKNTRTADGIEYTQKDELEVGNIGVGYHLASQRWNRIDWLASLRYQQAKLVESVQNEGKRTTTSDSLSLELGLRASITPKLETQAVIAGFYSDNEIKNEEKIDLTAVYRVLTHFDVALGVRNVSDTPIFNIGFRYSW